MPEASSPRVVVLGSLNMDLVARTPRLPHPGETLLGEDFSTYVGGKGLNQAVAAARLGASVALIGQVGNDAYGETLLAALVAEGVAVDRVSRHPTEGTGVACISVASEDGENAIVVIPRANGALTAEQVRAALQSALVGPPGVLLCQCEVPFAAVRAGLEAARAAGWRTLINIAPVPDDLDDDLPRLADIVILNEIETRAITGVTIRTMTDARTLIAALAVRYETTCVLTLGESGVVYCYIQGPPQRAHAFGMPSVVDTTAAGDAFCGALATRLAAGDTLAEALRWGTAAGALAVTVPGALPSLPTEDAVRTLLARRRSRDKS